MDNPGYLHPLLITTLFYVNLVTDFPGKIVLICQEKRDTRVKARGLFWNNENPRRLGNTTPAKEKRAFTSRMTLFASAP